MKIRLVIFLVSATIFIHVAYGENSTTWDTESICKVTCNCTFLEDFLGSVEFRASCEGNGQQVFLLGQNLFDNEPIPDRTRKIYVKVSNMSQVIVTGDFISRWRAYSSCSLDLWYISNIDFPKVCPTMAESNAISHVFAGIGIAHSKTEFLPDEIYAEKDKAKLFLQKATIFSLNLNKILGITLLGSLIINNSTIGTFYGDIGRPISLSRRGHFEIVDSQVAQITRGSLNLQPGSYAEPIALIQNTSIGIVETLSISLNGSIKMTIENCHFGEMRPKSMYFTGRSRLVAKNNMFGIYKQSLAGISCENGTNIITENTLIPLDALQCKQWNNGDFGIKIEDYLNSCENNCLYVEKPILLHAFPPMVTYVIMGVCLILVVLIAGLTGKLMSIYIFKFVKKRKASDTISSIYYAPGTVPPTDMTVFDSYPNNFLGRRESFRLSLTKGRPDNTFIENQFNNEHF